MSAATSSASAGVVRSHTTAHSHYRPTTGDLPQRTRSSAPRPSHHSSHSRSNSRPYSRDDHDVAHHPSRPSTSRRSISRDRAPDSHAADFARSHHHHRRTASRPTNTNGHNSSDITARGAAADGQSASYSTHLLAPNGASMGSQPKRRTTISTPTGQWALGKTIGAGSMGKVKLAKNLETGEQAAVKIIPRHSTEEHRNSRENERADRSKEIRTAREAAIVTLLNHPYVCGMKDVVRTNYHWYMLFEYVNGGQMLDYIISHGKLKEKQARKFARQIASALDYCHRNNIVHRDLKIENILISKTGDIKIIDFGLSNLYSPTSQLKTFCGSLYFAAPELLQARQYTGPEVDVWSFGIVLYVLVCGKVPFDDQSMPQLHAKIKKGAVEYPPFLSSECRHIISRMLVTDPKQRASLSEIVCHPWMTKGFSGPPDNYLPSREPVQLPLDSDAVRKMTGFDFGPPDYISTQLTQVIESEAYQNAVRASLKEQQSPPNPANEKKRGVFDFYKRRNSTSKEALSSPSLEMVHPLGDPVQGYNPLVSIYQLVREKIDRENREDNPGALSLHQPAGELPVKVPSIPAPEAAHTGQNAYEYPGEKDTRGRTRPRARTHGDDDITEDVKNMHLSKPNPNTPPTIVTPTTGQPPKKENLAVGLLRRFSTRRTRDKEKEKPMTTHGSTLNTQTPEDLPPPRKSFSMRKSTTRRGDASPTTLQWSDSQSQEQQHQESAKLKRSHESPSRQSKPLGRSTSVNSADYRTRRSGRRAAGPDILSSSAPQDPSLATDSERSSLQLQKPRPVDQEPKTGQHAQALRTKSLGHARHESIQARRARREEAKRSNVPEETDAELADAYAGAENANTGDEFFKPVYLKGLFSVSTTSSKPLNFIRSDIIRVLKQLGVEYTEIRGGFSCRHAPSIDLERIVEPSSPEKQGMVAGSHRRKISFGGLRGYEREEPRDEQRRSHSSRTTTPRRQQHAPDQSFVTGSEGSDEYVQPPRDSGVGERVIGETTTRVQNDTGENLVLKFEILIVKVPLFTLHGIQFKKVAGGMWQYREMAKKILDALKL